MPRITYRARITFGSVELPPSGAHFVMSNNNDSHIGSWNASDLIDGPSPLPTPSSMSTTPRQPLSRHGSRNTGNWPEASPLHHNEGTSYFSQPIRPASRSISPSVSRRIPYPTSTPGVAGPSSYARPSSQASHRVHRSVSQSSAHHLRRQNTRDTAFSEPEEDDDDEEDERSRTPRHGRRTPAPRANDDDSSGTDDPEGEAARAEAVSDAGSLDPVTLCVSLIIWRSLHHDKIESRN